MPKHGHPLKIRPLTSLRWKILLAFLLVVGISFAIMASMLTGLVSNYLFTRRTREDTQSVEKLATALSPYFQNAASETLEEELQMAAGEMGGRLLILDNFGKVQYDSFSLLYGARLVLPEVAQILQGNAASAYGMYTLTPGERALTEDSSSRVSYCSALITGTRGPLGVLLFISPVDELVASLTTIEQQMILLFALIALAAMVGALVISRTLTSPIISLTGTIQKMGRGDLSVRVPVKGSGELRELAQSYNIMAEQLESLDKSRNQFVSNASHELKTPLTTMKILLESLIYQPDMPAELRTEFMQDMNHEIDRLSGIVTDLLTLTRMDDHRIELKLETVSVSQLTRETLRLLTPQAEKRGQQLTAHINAHVHTLGDRSKLSQIFYNLTENALKYTPDGGSIAIDLRVKGGNIIWSVTDTGVGIPEQDIHHIFERFYRVDKARSRETGGTGLGLSIVKQLVTLHGGSIQVTSRYGEGSTFTVTLPIREEVAE